MELLDDLRREHDRIERVALSLRAFVRQDRCSGADARDYLRFFRLYAGAWHHEREEGALFPHLTADLLLPAGRGPIAVLLEDHRRMAVLLSRMEEAAGDGDLDLPAFRSLALEYSQSLLLHIDAENSVLFPECDDRLRRGGIQAIRSRDATAEELDAREAGESLANRYPAALIDAELTRGDGCVMCPSYGVSCDGVEREWWNEWQWEEFDEHVAAS